VVALDLGSNTLRVLEYDCRSDRATAEYEKIVKTADMLEQTGVIHHEAVERVIYAIKEAQEKIDFSGQPVRAVTTEALRRAKNAEDVLRRIRQEIGVRFEIIDGQEEARLTLLAVRHRLMKLHFGAERFALVDIGGGSTELIFVYGSKVVTRSFPVGIVTIAQKYGDLARIREALHEEMFEMQKFIAEIYATRGKADSFVATAGTPTTVAAMKLGMTYESYDAARINGTTLHKEELGFYLQKLLSMPFEQREESVGTGRSDLIAAGILIYQRLFELLEFDSGIVIDDGLREGVALDMCRKL
jgi:exopolyphosphatase/guanosine-5'-triphosphate,3'-diphosphate pyrophosphatase